ncbi:hypothetical protein MYVALT_G_02500 [Candidatus Vallotia tarda]|uniref:Uncharacterized protein n=1 Tax=Candidatus Vallotiella hemipterorum TaxID=1177213 RepID=A0A916NER1_9BURK|nr:hypothetical protein MYVALT_G_02500 [Candidatus Vallotia tarda]
MRIISNNNIIMAHSLKIEAIRSLKIPALHTAPDGGHLLKQEIKCYKQLT